MTPAEAARIAATNNQIAKNTSDLVALLHTELTLTQNAQRLDFTDLEVKDIVAVEIRIRKAGSPVDSGHIARFTQREDDTPTVSHGMYVGDGDVWTITGNVNIQAFKILATEALSHVANLIYYGYNT